MEEVFNISDNFKYRIIIMFLVTMIVYINIYNCLLYKNNKDIEVNACNYSKELGKEELLKEQREESEKEIYEIVSNKNILVEEYSKKADGNIKCTIVISGQENDKIVFLKELSEIPFLEIKNMGVYYNTDSISKLRVKFERR